MASALKDRITDDMKNAMRAKDAPRLSAIRLLLAACKQREVDERIELDDAAVVGLVDKLIKQRKDSVEAFAKAGRTDLVDKETAELLVLQAYLPQRLSQAEVAQEIDRLAEPLRAELGRALTGADMGKLMALAKAKLASTAEMSHVSAAVKAALSNPTA